jgi:hypothetical protein
VTRRAKQHDAIQIAKTFPGGFRHPGIQTPMKLSKGDSDTHEIVEGDSDTHEIVEGRSASAAIL